MASLRIRRNTALDVQVLDVEGCQGLAMREIPLKKSAYLDGFAVQEGTRRAALVKRKSISSSVLPANS